MSNNFMRRYIMKCGRQGQTGFQIGNITSDKENALHVCFSIEKADVESPNDAKVQIWNLSDNNLKILESEDCIVELRAGYGENPALILVGNVTSSITTRDGADRLTELTVVDGNMELRDAVVSLSYNGKVDTKEIYQKIANEMEMPIVFAKDLSFKKMPNGYCSIGKAKYALDKVAEYNGHKWTIQNQILNITLPGRAISQKAFVLSSDTGLLNVPKRISVDSEGSTQIGWEIEYLLNGSICVNDTVCIKSSTANGYFRVQKVTIDGDNLEGDWMCTAQVFEIKANAELDSKANNASSSSSTGSSTGAASSSAPSSESIKKGDKVKVTRTTQSGGKTKGYTYTGGTFVCWYDVYDVIQVKNNRVVIGVGSTITAAVNIKDLAKV